MRISVVAGLVLAFLLPLASASASSIDDPLWESERWPKNTVTTNPLGMALGIFNLEYERAVYDRVSIYGGPSYFGLGVDDTSIDAFGIDAGARFFVSGQAPEGFFLSPGVGVAHVSATGSDSVIGWTASALFGYTWLFDRAFALSLGFGGSYFNMKVEESGIRGFMPSLRASIGAAF